MRAEVNSSQLESKLLYGNPAEEGKHKYMASLQLNGDHICSSSMFQVGLLVTTALCAWSLGQGIQRKLERATAVFSDFDLQTGQRIDIFKIAYYSTYHRQEYEIGIVKVGQLNSFGFLITSIDNCV